MCSTCGCGSSNKIELKKPNIDGSIVIKPIGSIIEHSHSHSHGNYSHSHDHAHSNDFEHDSDLAHDHSDEYSHEHEHSHDGEVHSHGHSHSHELNHDDQSAHFHQHSDFDHDHVHAHEGQSHSHSHHHHSGHHHDSVSAHDHHHHSHNHVIELEQDILGLNNILAERNKGYFEAKNILALNLVSSPGSGKTSLLERTLVDLRAEFKFSVIEGDQQTTNDADRINATKVPVIQVNTGQGCHLDSDMINKALKELKPEDDSILFIENVGNLVCPALFKLGEEKRVVIISTTEGDDKPLKYPDMFASSDICIINKIDLLPYVDFSVERAKEFASRVNHNLQFVEVSARTGEGMPKWYDMLRSLKSKN